MATTLNQSQAELLKKTYATAEDLKASSNFQGMTSAAQQIALGAYAPAITPTTPANLDPIAETQPTAVPEGGRTVGGRIYDANGQYVGMEGSTTPTAPTPTVSPTKTTPKTDTTNINQETGIVEGVKLGPDGKPDYQDDSDARSSQIISNLEAYAQANHNAFTGDVNTFKKAFDVETGARTPAQDQLIMDWYNGKKAEVDSNNASAARFTELSSMSEEQLQSITDLADINLINQDPILRDKYEKAIKNKQILESVYGYDPREKEIKVDGIDGIAGNYSEEYAKAIADTQATKSQIEALQRQQQHTYDNLVKQAEGTGETDGYLRAKANKINAELNKQIFDLNSIYNSHLGTLSALEASETRRREEEESERAERKLHMEEMGFYYEYDPQGMAERAEAIFNIENPDINSSNPTTARRALNNELTKYYEQFGDIIIRPQSQALNDILAQAKADGSTLSAALKKNFTDELQEKTLYGQTLGKSLGFDMGSYSMSQLPDGNWTVSAKNTKEIRTINGVDYEYDPATNSYSKFNIASSRADVKSSLSKIISGASSTDIGDIASAVESGYEDGIYGGSCGEFINDISGAMGSDIHFGNTLANKIGKITTQDATVGSFVVMDTGVKDKTTGNKLGHVGLVTAVNTDGTITIKDSNRGSDKMTQTHTLTASEMKMVKGYAVPTADSTKMSTGSVNVSPLTSSIIAGRMGFSQVPSGDREQVSKELDDYIAQEIAGETDVDRSKIIQSLGYDKTVSDAFTKKYSALKTAKDGVANLEEAMNKVFTDPAIGQLIKKNNYDEAVIAAKQQIQAIVPTIARGVFGEVGVLTDNDIKNYMQTLPNFNYSKEGNANTSKWLNSLLKTQMKNTIVAEAKGLRNVNGYLDDYDWATETESTPEATPVDFSGLGGANNNGSTRAEYLASQE